MNIKITYNWLLDFLETKASPAELQKYLSLSGPSIERVEKVEDDYVFDVEIISNRVDTASVFGIAQEATAILPRYGIRARLKINPFEKFRFEKIKNKFNEHLKISVEVDQKLCSRFTALIFDNLTLGRSPDFIQKRLKASGIKVINNIVDISNYLMLTLGQPVHMFDFDKIFDQKMILRGSKKGEKIKILDGRLANLPEGSIVIEDGEGELTDLCGIMGGAKSAISHQTKRVILFVQTYKKELIRKTTMATGVRTLAATYFEKGIDEERVEPTIVYGAELLEKYANAKIASNLIDIYPNPYQGKKIRAPYSIFEKVIGEKIDKSTINEILTSLGFKLQEKGEAFEVVVPSYRKDDISIPEDLVEEVARIWGYDRIGVNLPPPAIVNQPREFEELFRFSIKTKYFLKHLGLDEVINYSMISKTMIKQWQLDEKRHLRLSNTISKEIEYLRLTLLASLYKNIFENTGRREILKFFELAKVYYRKKNELPEERYKLALAVNTDYFDLKGIIEMLLSEFNLNEVEFERGISDQFYCNFFNPEVSATGFIKNQEAFYLGQSKINERVFFAEIDFETLVKYSRLLKTYIPLNPYSVIKLDLRVRLDINKSFSKIKKKIFSMSNLIQRIEVIDQYQDKITLRFYFNDPERNLTEERAKEDLTKIEKIIYDL
ncbi:MAG: phenylalanine--tRNA ligase subunit beta [Patescibacteria group bacterium]|nr:phenylalanine--tRNA ligase subunit beta [Patescibacteria group bacterium]